VRANRIVAGVRIPHPVSNPTVAPEKELGVRTAVARRALEVLTLPVDGPTVFTVDHPGAR
jgi:glycine reductase